MKPKTKMKKKVEQARKLAKLALIDKPEWKPAKGHKYLEDIEPGTKVTTSTSEAILIQPGRSSCTVIVTDWFGHPENASAHMGKRLWAPKTEVKEV